MSKPPISNEDAGAESTTAVAAAELVTLVDADLELVAPTDCCASVLLKQVDRIGSLRSPGEIVFALWLVAGRYEMSAAKVPYEHQQGQYTIRIDVPRGIELSLSYLLEQLQRFWKEKEPTLPPDTPVIKG